MISNAQKGGKNNDKKFHLYSDKITSCGDDFNILCMHYLLAPSVTSRPLGPSSGLQLQVCVPMLDSYYFYWHIWKSQIICCTSSDCLFLRNVDSYITRIIKRISIFSHSAIRSRTLDFTAAQPTAPTQASLVVPFMAFNLFFFFFLVQHNTQDCCSLLLAVLSLVSSKAGTFPCFLCLPWC